MEDHSQQTYEEVEILTLGTTWRWAAEGFCLLHNYLDLTNNIRNKKSECISEEMYIICNSRTVVFK
jgi:hypothetical protein